MTGPRSLTFAEAAAEMAEASGREVRYVPVSLEQHAAEAAARGVPAEVVELLTYLFSEVVGGSNATTTDGAAGPRPQAGRLQRLRGPGGRHRCLEQPSNGGRVRERKRWTSCWLR